MYPRNGRARLGNPPGLELLLIALDVADQAAQDLARWLAAHEQAAEGRDFCVNGDECPWCTGGLWGDAVGMAQVLSMFHCRLTSEMMPPIVRQLPPDKIDEIHATMLRIAGREDDGPDPQIVAN